MRPQGQEARVRAALAAWAPFPAGRQPRPVVLLSSPLAASGFPDEVTLHAYLHGAIEARPGFPAPVLAALREAMRGWPRVRRASEGPYQGPPLVLVSAASGRTARFDTDRGPRLLPVWEVRIGDGHEHEPGPIVVLDPGCDIWRPPGQEPGGGGLGSQAAVAADDRTLTASFLVAPGTRTDSSSVRALEEGNAVALFWPEPDPPASRRPGTGSPGQFQPGRPPVIAAHQRHEVTVQLAQPLGGRVLLDGHGAPVSVTPAT